MAHSHDLTVSEVEQWKADFIARAQNPFVPIPAIGRAVGDFRATALGQDRRTPALGGYFKNPTRQELSSSVLEFNILNMFLGFSILNGVQELSYCVRNEKGFPRILVHHRAVPDLG